MMQLRRRCTNALLLGLAIAAGTVGATEARAASKNPLAAQPLELLSDTRERPLFAPTRRPPVPPPNVVLLGVVTDENGPRVVVPAAPIR